MIDGTAIQEQLNREFACNHARSCTTYLVTVAGTKVFRRQCRRCGAQVETLRKGDLTQAEREAAIPHDKAIQPAWWKRKHARSNELYAEASAREAATEEQARKREDAAWWARYNAHLLTPKWRRKRDLVMRRSGGWCEGCGERAAAHVHHLTYEHMGDEFLFELAAVCVPCHARIHPGKFQSAGVAMAATH